MQNVLFPYLGFDPHSMHLVFVSLSGKIIEATEDAKSSETGSVLAFCEKAVLQSPHGGRPPYCAWRNMTLFRRALYETGLINHTAGLSKLLVSELLSTCLIPAGKNTNIFHWTRPAGPFLNSKDCWRSLIISSSFTWSLHSSISCN